VTVNKRGLLTGFKWFSIWLIASVALTALVIEVVDPRYLFNDDMVIAAVASGDYTGTPDPHTLNGGALLSVLVATLYGLFPGVAWWLWVVTFISLGAALAVGLRMFRLTRYTPDVWRGPAIASLGAAAALLFLLVAAFLATPSYTVAAFFPVCAAILLAASAIFSPNESLTVTRVKSWGLPVLVGLLLSMTVLIRTGLFALAGSVAVSIVFWFYITRIATWRQRLSVVGVTSLFWLVSLMINRVLYLGEPWRTGKRLFEQTHILVDTYLLGALTPIGLSQGWRGYEIGFASGRYFVPSDAFTVNSFESFIDAANPYRIGLWAITPPSTETLNNVIIATRAGWSVALVGLAIALALLIYSRQATKLRVGALLLSASIGISVILFLGFIRNNPGHVALPLGFVSAISSLCLVALWVVPTKERTSLRDEPKVWQGFALVLLAVGAAFVVMTPYRPTELWQERENKQVAWPVYEETYSSLEAGCPILGVNLGFELAPANAPTPAQEFPVIQLSWNSLTPLTDERLKLLGFEKWDDLFAEGACTYFMGGGDYANAMTEYARDRGGVGEFVRVEVPVEGAPEIYQWQNP
jgi:hypothetical protein